MKKGLWLIAVLLLTSTALPAVEAPDTSDQLHQLFTDGKYQELIPKLNKAIALKGDAAKAYDRYDLLTLKGETHLRLKAAGPAADAFRDAAKATDKPDDAALAHATELLIKQSGNSNYTPKTGDAKNKPIGIIEAETRKQAFAALFADMKSKTEPKVKSAANSKNLPPIFEIAPALGDLRSVEVAATGDQKETTQMTTDLSAHATDLLSDTIKTMGERVEAISADANSLLEVGLISQRSAVTDVVRVGLTGHQPQELKQIEADSGKIAGAVRDLALAFGSGGDAMQKVSEEAQKVQDRAHAVLTDTYGVKHGGGH